MYHPSNTLCVHASGCVQVCVCMCLIVHGHACMRRGSWRREILFVFMHPCVHACLCMCVCVYTCMFTHIDGRRVFGSYDSNGVVNWNRNNEEMHRYTMSFVYMKWILAGPAPMSIALPGPAAVSIALPIASFLCKRSNGLLRVKRKHVVCGLGR